MNYYAQQRLKAVALGIASIALIVGIAAGSLWLESYKCGAKAKVLGFAYSWEPLQGCAIEYAPGKWVPIERYRVADDGE